MHTDVLYHVTCEVQCYISMVQSSRSRALLAVFLGCLALCNRCMCIPGGASTMTTSKISEGHRSQNPFESKTTRAVCGCLRQEKKRLILIDKEFEIRILFSVPCSAFSIHTIRTETTLQCVYRTMLFIFSIFGCFKLPSHWLTGWIQTCLLTGQHHSTITIW